MTSHQFTTGALYKHRRNQDVAMYVANVQYRGPEYVQLRARWWNLGHQSFCTDVVDTVRVKVKDFDGWKRIES